MMPLFLSILFFVVHTSIKPHSSVAISPSPHRWSAQWEKPPWGAEPRIELGPAIHQVDALLTELRRTLNYIK